MKISLEKLQAESQATGFRAEVLEKVLHLLNLLESLQSHPFLKGRLTLKGGTALNLFFFDLPRLSVDIDLNYIGAVDRRKMLEDRPQIEQAVRAVCSREGITVTRIPEDHAGGKWLLRYESSLGEGGKLALDLNFMFRVPIWPVTKLNSRDIGSYRSDSIRVLDLHELAAGKLAALLSRRASRDLFDAHMLLTQGDLDPVKLRLGVILYGAMNRKDWRTVKAEDVSFDAGELEHQLIPMLRRDFINNTGTPRDWAMHMMAYCRQKLDAILSMTTEEKEFLNLLLDHGEIEPSLLTSDESMAVNIKSHPLLLWKSLNVKQHNKREYR